MTFKSKYKSRYTKDYDDMMSDDMSRRYRCDNSRCGFYIFCPHYRNPDDETSAMIHINFRKYEMCPKQDEKPPNNNFIKFRYMEKED